MKFHRHSGISGGEPASDEQLLLQDKNGVRRGGEESGDVWNLQREQLVGVLKMSLSSSASSGCMSTCTDLDSSQSEKEIINCWRLEVSLMQCTKKVKFDLFLVNSCIKDTHK